MLLCHSIKHNYVMINCHNIEPWVQFYWEIFKTYGAKNLICKRWRADGDGYVSEVKAKVIVLLLFTNYYGI